MRRHGRRDPAPGLHPARGRRDWLHALEPGVRPGGVDLLDVQQEIAQAVVGRLQVELQGNEADRLTRSWTEDPQAYDHFLRGIQYQLRAPTADNVAAGIGQFERAIELDPTFGRAYARLAVQQIVVGNMMLGSPARRIPKPNGSPGRRSNWMASCSRPIGRWVGRSSCSGTGGRRHASISSAPSRWPPASGPGTTASEWPRGRSGDFEPAMEAARIAFDLDPLAYWPALGLRTAHLRLRDYDAAVRQLEAQVEVQPDDPWSRAAWASCWPASAGGRRRSGTW